MKERKGTGLSRDKNLRINKNAGYKFVKKDKSVNKRAGLHDKKINIAEGERRVVRVKPLALKHKRRMRKAAVVLAALCVGAVSYVGLGFLFKPEGLYVEDLGNFTVKAVRYGDDSVPEGGGKVYYYPEDGSLPTEHTLIENVAYLNYVLNDVHTNWSSYMDSTVYTVMQQHVYTHKKSFKDEATGEYSFVSADMAVGASNTARQFCVTEEEVIWREAAGRISLENMDETDWNENTYYGNTISEFRSYRGLPANEFSVYILDENTVKNATETSVKDNGDGTYTMTLDLKVHQDGLDSAVHYYKQQMYVTGGLYAWPTFDFTRVTYTFTSDWTLLSFTINDSYSAKMGVIAAACTSESTTTFNYEKENAVNTYRKDEFAAHENGNYIRYSPFGNERKLDAATCLANAFGSVLEEGATFKIDMNLNGRELGGAVYLGLNDGNISDLRAALGELKIFLGNDNGKNMLYLAAGKDKFKLCTDGILGSGPEDGASAGNSLEGVFDANDLMKQLFAGEFELQEKSASLKSTLSLFGIEIPVEFAFKVRGLDATLDYVSTSFSLNGSSVNARLEFGSEEDIPAAPSENEKRQYKDILNEGITLNLKLGLDNLVLNGAAEIELVNGRFKGINACLGDYCAYYSADDGLVYLNIGGYKYKLDTFKLDGGNPAGVAASASGADVPVLQRLINFIAGGISTDGNGINFSGVLDSDNSFNVLGTVIKLGVDVNLSGYLGVNVKIDIGGKTAFAEVTVAENNSVIPAIGNTDEYKDILNEGITFEISNLKIDGLELSGSVYIGLSAGKITDIHINLSNYNGDISVYYDSLENMLYLKTGDGVKVKLPASVLGFGDLNKESNNVLSGLLGETDINGILNRLLNNLTFGETSLCTSVAVDIKDIGKVNIGAVLNLKDGADVGVTVDILNKNIALKAGLAHGDRVPELTNKQKSEYADILNEGFNVRGNIRINVGGTDLDLAINKLAVSLRLQNDGTVKFGFALDTRLTVKDMYFDIFVSYVDGIVKMVYGDEQNYLGARFDIANGDLGKLEETLVSVYNRISAVLDEIITNNPLKPIDKTGQENQSALDNLTNILSKLGVAISIEQGGANVLEMLGIPENGGKIDVKELISGLKIYSPEDSIFGVTLGNMALQLKNSGISASLDFEMADSATRLYIENVAISGYDAPTCPVGDGDLLTADDFAEMLDYLAAAAELLVEDEYSLSADATIYENDAVSYEVKILFEFIKGEKFPVHITLPDKDNDGNKSGALVEFDSDMYWHLGVTLDNADENKDDLYIDVYILDANPVVSNGITTTAKTTTGNGLDVYVSVSKYGSKELDANYAPLKVYAPVNEILTVLAAGVALLDLQDIDISEESAALQSVISQLATLLDDALVKTYLPLTHSQFNSLGASLIPQIIGSDISTLLKDILKTVSTPVNGENAGETPLTAAAPNEPEFGHYINKISLGTSGAGDRMLRIVLNSQAIYGEGFGNITFEAYKNYSYGAIFAGGAEEETLKPVKSYITGAAVKNIYYGGNKKLDLGLEIARSVARQTAFDGYYDFSGIDALLKAVVNSATHSKANATDLDKQIYGDKLTDYLLNRYYYLQGKIDLHIPVLNKDYQIGLAAAAHIDKANDVKINLSLDIPAIQEVMQVVTNGNTHTDLTIKNGMVYIKRVQNSYWKKSGLIYSEKKYDTPVTIYRVMPIGEFSANVMENIVFLMNLGPVVTDNIKNTAPAEPVKDVSDFGAKIGKYLKSFIYTGNSNSANWALTIKGDCVDFGTNMIGLNDIVVTLNASSRYDELTNSNLYTLTGLSIKTGLSLANILNITVDGNINYCNPQLVMGKQYKDSTVDLSEKWENLFGCDSKTLGVAANGINEDEGYTPEEIAASELWNRAIASLNGSYAGKNYIEINLSSSTGVNLGEIALNENGKKIGSLTILYGSWGLLSVAPAIPEWEEKTGYTLKVDYTGGIANGAYGVLDFSKVNDFTAISVNANYTPNTYKVNVIVDEEKGTVYTLDYVYGTRLPLAQYIGVTVTDENGKVYVLDSFILNGKKYYGDIESFNITEETTLIANWTDITADAEYTVTYVAGGKTVATRTVKYGEKISGDIVPGFNVTGYDFAGWDFCGVDTCYGSREITAIYTPHVYTVTLDASAYAGCGKEGQLAEAIADAGFADGKLYYTYGKEALILNAIDSISGYDFVRYYVLNENGEKVDISSVYMLTEDLTVYAEFNDVRININLTSDVAFNYNGQTAVEKEGKFVLNTNMVREESTMLNAENAEGWQFLGWWYAVTDGNGGTAYNRLSDVLSIARPGEKVETEIRALWGRAGIAGTSTKSGGFFSGYDYTMVSTANYEFKGYDGVINKISRTATEYDWYLDNGLTPVMTKEINNVNGNNQLTCAFDKLHLNSTSGIMNNWKVSCRLTFVLTDGTEFVLSASGSGKF